MAEQTVRIEGSVKDDTSSKTSSSSYKARQLPDGQTQRLNSASQTLARAANRFESAVKSYQRASSRISSSYGLTSRAHISDGRNTRTVVEKMKFGGAESVSVVRGLTGVMTGNYRQAMMFSGQFGRLSFAIAGVVGALGLLQNAATKMANDAKDSFEFTMQILRGKRNRQMENFMFSGPRTPEKIEDVKKITANMIVESNQMRVEADRLGKKYAGIKPSYGWWKAVTNSIPFLGNFWRNKDTKTEKKELLKDRIDFLEKEIENRENLIDMGLEYTYRKPTKPKEVSILDNMSKMGLYMTKNFAKGEGNVQYEELKKGTGLLQKIEQNTRRQELVALYAPDEN